MKKILLLSVLILMLSIFSTVGAQSQINITFWDGVGAPENVVMQDLVAQFNETNEDNIHVEIVEMDWSTLWSKLLLDTKTGNAPDVTTFQMSILPQYIKMGVIQPITDIAGNYGLTSDMFVESPWNGTFLDGEQYAIPLDTHTIGVFYNKDLFIEAGLDPETPPTTTAELLEYAKKLTKDENGDGVPEVYGMALPYSGGIAFRLWMSYLWQHEGEGLFNEDGTKAAFNTEAGVESWKFLQDLIFTENVAMKGENDTSSAFASGRAAMIFEGPWENASFQNVEGLNYGTAAFPLMGDKPAVWGDSHVLVLGKTEDETRMDASMKFVKWMSDQDLYWSENAGHQPVRLDVLATEEYAAIEHQKGFAENIPNVHYYPYIAQSTEVYGRDPTSPFIMLAESIMLNDGDIKENLTIAENAVNAILGQ